ncbi:MAG: DUF3524 domain-containing protein [Sedimentisphaerales bacterium]|nr:DUF3524 domain-containing protein [Sedimentisphaerales bacterium]
MKILALESYYGGSHKAFIDVLSNTGKHNWTILTLPANKWKWRMRHSAITFAQQSADLLKKGKSWDILFCSDMLNLAEFVALAPKEIADLTKVIYFHENQLTYPVRVEDERDYQFAMTNLTSTLAADAVWFNSHFHKNAFLDALAKLLKSMPDNQPLEVIKKIREKSSVHYPGVADFPDRSKRNSGPIRILWAARWEHDKNPEDFFKALKILKSKNVEFKISVIGQSFRDIPGVFKTAEEDFKNNIEHWGYQKTRLEYESILSNADVVVSTANHEFFGISIVEAVASGAYPLVPNRLSYPEILDLAQNKKAEDFFYNGTAKDLAEKLELIAKKVKEDKLWPSWISPEIITARFKWTTLTHQYDKALESLAGVQPL